MRSWILTGAAILVFLVWFGVRRLEARLPGMVRDRIVSTLRQHFASDVEFSNLQISLFPHIVVRGENLVFRLHGRTDVPPLIVLKKVSTEANFLDLLRPTHHISKITLEGLTITMPPRDPTIPPPPKKPHKEPSPYKVVVDEIVADGAELDMMVSPPDRPPHVFMIKSLRLHDAGLGGPMKYEATLTNPVPEGLIVSHGSVGPWERDEPRLTPVDGKYTFENADLSTIRRLEGTLNSKGQFKGILERIEVDGETHTPDFGLGINGNPVPLDTTFHAIVDGTTGNTMLDPVRAKLLNTEIVARGGVYRMPGQRYRRVLLDAVSKNGRLEDMLRLAVKSPKPPMTGDVEMKTRIDIPPGTGAISERMKLNGQFEIKAAQFSELNIQSKVASLSHHGQGDPQDKTPGDVASNFSGKFVLDSDVMKVSELKFGVPGALVDLDGTYTLNDQALDFAGHLRLDATLSQMTTGWKSLLLKPFNRLFEKDGAGMYLPIKVSGTGSDPHFGVDVHHVF